MNKPAMKTVAGLGRYLNSRSDLNKMGSAIKKANPAIKIAPGYKGVNLKSSPKKMSATQKAAVRKKKVGNAANKLMFNY